MNVSRKLKRNDLLHHNQHGRDATDRDLTVIDDRVDDLELSAGDPFRLVVADDLLDR